MREAEDERNERALAEREARFKTELEKVEARSEKALSRQETEIDRLQKRIGEFEEKERKHLMDEMDRLRAQASAPKSEASPELLQELNSLRKVQQDAIMTKTTLDFEIKKLNFEKQMLEGDRKLTEERLNRANEEISRLKVEVDQAELRSRRGGGSGGGGGGGDSSAKVKELTEKNAKLKSELDNVRSVERTAAIKSCAKMMTNERKKTAKLIQVSRNLKKRRDDLEKCTKELILAETTFLEKARRMRQYLDPRQQAAFDSESEKILRQINDAKALAEGKGGEGSGDVPSQISQIEKEIKKHEEEANRSVEDNKTQTAKFERLKGELEQKGLHLGSPTEGLDAQTLHLLEQCKQAKLDQDASDSAAKDHYNKILELSNRIKGLKKQGGGEPGEPAPPSIPESGVAKGDEDCVIS
jgi:hypothetical protein